MSCRMSSVISWIAPANRPCLVSRDKDPDSTIVASLFCPVSTPHKSLRRLDGYLPGSRYLRIGHAATVIIPDIRPDIIHDSPLMRALMRTRLAEEPSAILAATFIECKSAYPLAVAVLLRGGIW